MKSNKIFGVLLAGVSMIMLCQCKENSSVQSATADQGTLAGMKIAYVEIDTLLSKYQFYIDMAEELLRKEENSRLLLAEKANEFQSEVETFQRKLQNNVFSSQERAQQEQNRLAKKQQDIEELNTRLSNELALESQNNSLKISEVIQAYLKKYNENKGYSIILTKVGDNILLIDESMNITDEVLAGLNAEYKAVE